MSATEVLFDEVPGEGGQLGLITLNRPEVLNSLNLVMIQAMRVQLEAWAQNDKIKAVVIRSVEGRAFCAGGDLRSGLNFDFFRNEYQLNRQIYHYPKPYIALLDGITMGGGVGISIHGSHRVGTDRLVFAMPETGIGFFPDVGGTYFLPRLSGYMGFYLGLTGARLTIDDCVALGVVQHRLSSAMLPTLIETLAKRSFQDNARETVTNIIREFTISSQASHLYQKQADIDQCFSKGTMENIMNALRTSPASFCQDAAVILSKKSPTSLKVTLAALTQGKQLNFDACMRQEYRLACHFTQGHDFPEGVRAVIIDKDQSPRWVPATLEEVTPPMVENYFSPLAEELV